MTLAGMQKSINSNSGVNTMACAQSVNSSAGPSTGWITNSWAKETELNLKEEVMFISLTGKALETAEAIQKQTEEFGLKDLELSEDQQLTLFMINHAFPKDEIFREMLELFMRRFAANRGNKQGLIAIVETLRDLHKTGVLK
jgi:hypothetical protein